MNRIFPFLILVMIGGAAHAQTVQTAYAGGTPAVLTIPVTASIGGRCGFADGEAPSGTHTAPNFDQTGFFAQFNFSLNCTGPSRVAITSSNGGLQTEGTAANGYVTKADYNVTLNLAANNGSTASATCAASTLIPGSTCTFAGQASTSQGLRLAAAAVDQTGSYVRVSAPAQNGSTVLVAGNYNDALTVTISPSL